MWIMILGLAFASLPAAIGITRLYGAARRRAGTGRRPAMLAAEPSALAPKTYDPRELEGLPAPVQRYFHKALRPGQPIIAAAHIEHAGTFNLGETRPSWTPYTSTEVVTTRRPDCDRDGKVERAPGLPPQVHEAYVEGERMLQARLVGLIRKAEISSLLRYLADAMWYPTALLPSQRVRWEPIDATSARATLTDGGVTVSLDFHFGADGLIESTRAAARPRMLSGKVVASPWGGRGWSYERCGGMRIPMAGEVSWLLPEGKYPYWRGQVTGIRYEFAR